MAGPPMFRHEDRIRYVQSVFQRVLKLQREMSPDDDFFALGGASMTAMEAIDMIEAEQGVRLPIHKFYQATAIGELAGALAPAATESTGGA